MTGFVGVVYRGRENTIRMHIQEENGLTGVITDMSWVGIDRMVLNIYSIVRHGVAGILVAVADTDVETTLINFTLDGYLTLKLGDLQNVDAGEIPAGDYLLRLTGHSSALDTEILHEATQAARLRWTS